MLYVLENRNKNSEQEEQLAPTLKSFSPHYKHLAKGQIFKLIHELEIQQLTQNLTSSPSSSSPPIPVISPTLPSSEEPRESESVQHLFSNFGKD